MAKHLQPLFYFKNEKGDIRLVKQVNSDTFVVVKLLKSGSSTLKIWKGTSIEKTSSYWSTKQFIPSEDEQLKLTELFNNTLQTFHSALILVSRLKAAPTIRKGE